MTPDSPDKHHEPQPAPAEKKDRNGNGLSVRQKIHIGFGGLIMLMAVSMGITLFKLNDVGQITTSVIEERQPAVNLFQRLIQDLNLATTLLNGYLLTGQTDLREEYEITEKNLFARLSYTYRLTPTVNGEIDTQQLDHAKKLLTQFAAYADKLYELRDNNANNPGLVLAQNTLNTRAIQFLGFVNILLESEDFNTSNPEIILAHTKLQKLRYNWVQMMSNLRVYLSTQSKSNLANFKNFGTQTNVLLDELAQMEVEIGFGELDALIEIRKEYIAHLQPVFDIITSDRWRADSYLIKTELRPILDELRQLFESIADAQLDKAWESGQTLTDAQQQIRFSTIVILAASLLLGGLLALRITSGIIPPIQRLMKAAKQVASGDLNTKVMVTSNDEIGQLGGSFNAMINDLRAAALNEKKMLDELHTLNQELETRVQDRTRDFEASETKIRAILENIGEGIIVLNESGRIESINPAAEQIFLMTEEEAIGVNATLLIADEDTSKIADISDYQDEQDGLFKSGDNQQPKEYQGHRSDGTKFSMELVVSSMELGEKRMRVCIVRDITARKATEATLANVQTQLVDAAHKSGMADMATGVLHNIGNILNSVNLSGGEILRATSNSKVKGLIKANKLLTAHNDNMGEFLLNDTRGQKLPDYFIKIGKVLDSEITAISTEAKALLEKTTMMKEVINTQQTYARSGFHSEGLNISELIDDALKIQDASLAKWGVKLHKHFTDLPECTGQKSKLLQVITNLIKNAKEAMTDNDNYNKPKELTIETGMLNASIIYLKIKDNGCGINESQLSKIFSHGFTTKQEGHGFGLHTSANAMTEMKGSLTVDSKGIQKGACFTLTLPIYKAKAA